MAMTPVYIRLTRTLLEPGTAASRFWGSPALPPGSPYPVYSDADGVHPYFFLCQINLEEFAPYDVDKRLPDRGLLSFFAKIDQYLGYWGGQEGIGGQISGRDAVKVMYFPSCEGLTEVRPEDVRDIPAVPAGLRMDFSLTAAPLSDDHAVFARPDHRPWETWDHPFEDREILLQVDSFEGDDFSLLFMDAGVLDFLISPSDLEQRRFDDVRAVVLSS